MFHFIPARNCFILIFTSVFLPRFLLLCLCSLCPSALCLFDDVLVSSLLCVCVCLVRAEEGADERTYHKYHFGVFGDKKIFQIDIQHNGAVCRVVSAVVRHANSDEDDVEDDNQRGGVEILLGVPAIDGGAHERAQHSSAPFYTNSNARSHSARRTTTRRFAIC